MQYLDFSKLKYAVLPDYYKYDPDRPMPKGFGPLDYSGKRHSGKFKFSIHAGGSDLLEINVCISQDTPLG